ncbi:MAG: single-stranded DNA-binding protein, partial [Oscillochloris sp.]|nr:single-stranded DNA-binding protein [Oscillochloris sp.]
MFAGTLAAPSAQAARDGHEPQRTAQRGGPDTRKEFRLTRTQINHVELTGNLGSDPETRFSSGGTLIAQARIAVRSSWKAGDDWQERTDWFALVAFGPAAEVLAAFSKGERIQVAGRLQVNSWTDRDSGQRRERVEVVVLHSAAAPLRRSDDTTEAEAKAEPQPEPLQGCRGGCIAILDRQRLAALRSVRAVRRVYHTSSANPAPAQCAPSRCAAPTAAWCGGSPSFREARRPTRRWHRASSFPEARSIGCVSHRGVMLPTQELLLPPANRQPAGCRLSISTPRTQRYRRPLRCSRVLLTLPSASISPSPTCPSARYVSSISPRSPVFLSPQRSTSLVPPTAVWK